MKVLSKLPMPGCLAHFSKHSTSTRNMSISQVNAKRNVQRDDKLLRPNDIRSCTSRPAPSNQT